MPRSRKEGFDAEVFKGYKRKQEKVDVAIRGMFVAGVSIRRVGDVLQILLEDRESAGTVSEVAKALDSCVEAFQKRCLEDKYIYLFLGGVYSGIKGAVKARKRPVLLAYGITEDGERELIDFRVAKSESEAQWFAFLNDLYKRGLVGESLKLIIIEGAPGLMAALDVVYPYTKRERCWAHKLRNVANYLPKRYQRECINQVRSIYEAPHRMEGVAHFREWADECRSISGKPVRCLERYLEELLIFLDFPEAHRKKIRTTNVIERSFREA